MIGLECGVLFVASTISLRVAINVLRAFPRRQRVHCYMLLDIAPTRLQGGLFVSMLASQNERMWISVPM